MLRDIGNIFLAVCFGAGWTRGLSRLLHGMLLRYYYCHHYYYYYEVSKGVLAL